MPLKRPPKQADTGLSTASQSSLHQPTAVHHSEHFFSELGRAPCTAGTLRSPMLLPWHLGTQQLQKSLSVIATLWTNGQQAAAGSLNKPCKSKSSIRVNKLPGKHPLRRSSARSLLFQHSAYRKSRGSITCACPHLHTLLSLYGFALQH